MKVSPNFDLDYEGLKVEKESQELLSSLYAHRIPLRLTNGTSPTMAASFNPNNTSHLLLGYEDGEIQLINCIPQGGDTIATNELHRYPDAIFDLAWSPCEESEFAAAVADSHVYIHNAESLQVQKCLGYHESSIRTVRYRPHNSYTLATASRDGSIAIWDLRIADTNSSKNQPVNVIVDAHSKNLCNRRKNDSSASVTSFEFMPLRDHLIASIGQPDYDVRIWDLRYSSRRGTTPTPYGEITAPLHGRRKRAFVSLCTDSIGSSIFAVSSDNHIYKYLTSNFSNTPLDILSAPNFRTNGSFYIRSTVSPDDKYLLCGSTDGFAYVWPTNNKRREAFLLGEHRYEVSCVAWSQCGNFSFVGGEDYVSRIWYKGKHDGDDDDVRYMKPSIVKLTKDEYHPRKLGKWKEGMATLSSDRRCNFLEPWPSRTIPPVEVRTPLRIPFTPITINSPVSTPNDKLRKRQTLLDTYFSPLTKRISTPKSHKENRNTSSEYNLTS